MQLDIGEATVSEINNLEEAEVFEWQRVPKLCQGLVKKLLGLGSLAMSIPQHGFLLVIHYTE